MIFGSEFDEGINMIPCFMIIQFVYTVIIWAVVLSEKPGYALIQLFAFIGHIGGFGIIFQTGRYNREAREDPYRRFWTKMFPFGAFMGILWSFVPLIICFMSGLRDWFRDDTGKVVICVFSSVFLLTWINIYIAGEYNRQKLYPAHRLGPVVEDKREQLSRSVKASL